MLKWWRERCRIKKDVNRERRGEKGLNQLKKRYISAIHAKLIIDINEKHTIRKDLIKHGDAVKAYAECPTYVNEDGHMLVDGSKFKENYMKILKEKGMTIDDARAKYKSRE